MESITLDVKGMTCGGCVNSVKRVLTSIDGVSLVEVSLDSGKVQVGYDPARAQPDQFKAAIRDAGYEVS
ncbi:heavy-metal-associated domain-containing protein [Thiobacter aerophilum]|uniref:Copper ion binding protein n=1 Tax=Thiobacter aerophilum TaxID=3121275 RepID=A0ABV0ECA4_9BURK